MTAWVNSDLVRGANTMLEAGVSADISLTPDSFRYVPILLKKSALAALVLRWHTLFGLMTRLSNHLCRLIVRLWVVLSGFWRHAGTAIPCSGGFQTSFASFLRFCAVAASRNSSRAPNGPRNRNRPSFNIRFRCANSISTFLRWCLDCSAASVPARARATSREYSLTSRGILR